MDVNISKLMNRAEEMHNYSASCMELGDDAGNITWQNACDQFDPDSFDTWSDWKENGGFLVSPTDREGLQTLRDWIGEFGAWDDSEIESWNPQELNALLLQFIAGNIREAIAICGDIVNDPDAYAEYERESGEGHISGGLYRCDIPGHAEFGEWFFDVGI